MENLLPWFRLKSVPGIGDLLCKRLLDYFGTPEQIFAARSEDLLQIEGMSPRRAAALKRHRLPETAANEIERLIKKGFAIVTRKDPDYPPLLNQIPDPPLFLYVYGRLKGNSDHIAVVGSRNATEYGLTTTGRLCCDLALRGATVVSGMAKGIDTAAHEGALSGRGQTVAVLGSGLENVYPPENLKLFHRIAENGAVISEQPLTAEPEAHHFPRRNRIISGMSLGTVVVEAGKRSGALITAQLAAEQNREVFAVPGSVQSFKSIGTHILIKQGAKLVEHAQDILEEFPSVLIERRAPAACTTQAAAPGPPALSPDESTVYRTLGPYPAHIDDIVRKLGIQPGKLAGILLQLELKGVARQSPGKYFSRAPE